MIEPRTGIEPRTVEHGILYRDPHAYCAHPHAVLTRSGTLAVVFNKAPRRKAILHPPQDPLFMNLVTRSEDGGRSWSAPEVVPDYRWTGVESTCLTELSDGRLMLNQWIGEWLPLGLAKTLGDRTDLVFPNQLGARWAQSPEFGGGAPLGDDLEREFPWARGRGATYAHFSSDEGRSFTTSVEIDTAPFSGGYAKSGGLQLADGRILVPLSDVYHFRRVFLVESADGGATWSAPRLLAELPGSEFEEPAIHRCPSGKLVMILRDNGRRELHRIVSHDDGRSWSSPSPIGLKGYPAHLLQLHDGRLLMTYGWRYPDYGIRAVWSDDEAETWSETIVSIRDGMGSPNLGYPATVQLPDGELLTIYYGEDGDGTTAILMTRWTL